MKKINFYLIAFLILTLAACKVEKEVVQEKQKVETSIANPERLHVMFYNVENLFDVEDDPFTKDEEFTPTGKKSWTEERYQDKLEKLSDVLTSVGGELPDIIGLCEVENRKVVEDLSKTGVLAEMGYAIVHKDSPDGRGIDVAMLINKKKVNLIREDYLKTNLPYGDRPNTRLILHATTLVGDDTLHVFVNHWPSRYGGQVRSEPNRMETALTLKREIDLIYKKNPNANILIMGDFNDYPNNVSLYKVLRADGEKRFNLQNLMWSMNKNGEGTYNYKGEWGCLDQFIVSKDMLDENNDISVFYKGPQIVKHQWMMFKNDNGELYPSRTYAGPNYYGGYSDHLPIYLQLNIK